MILVFNLVILQFCKCFLIAKHLKYDIIILSRT